MKRVVWILLFFCTTGYTDFFDINALTNGGAEVDGVGTVATGWRINPLIPALPAIQMYFPTNNNPEGWPDTDDPGPDNRGTNFFYGGENPFSSMTQSNSVPSGYTNYIDEGRLNFIFSAWLGGYDIDPDFASATMQLMDETYSELTNVVLGPVTDFQRNGVTGLFLESHEGDVPAGARYYRVTVTFVRFQGTANDGYADEISLQFTPTTIITSFNKTNEILYFTVDNLLTVTTNAIDCTTNLLNGEWMFMTNFVATNATENVVATNPSSSSNAFFRVSSDL